MTTLDESELLEIIRKINVGLKRPSQHKIVINSPTAEEINPRTIRFHLYHNTPSLCSAKVRLALAEKGINYYAHDVDIKAMGEKIPENYKPDYVRMRLLGKPEGKALVGTDDHDTKGFDPAVVPTLIDLKTKRVVADSVNICKYIGLEVEEGPCLYPSNLLTEINNLIDIVDKAPHTALVYGANPDHDHRPGLVAMAMNGAVDRKIKALEKCIANCGDDEVLVNAYRSKIKHEIAVKDMISDDVNMKSVVGRMEDDIKILEKKLSDHGKLWACGDEFTMADVFWTASLFRMQWIGIGYLFSQEKNPYVHAYAERLLARQSFQTAMCNWALPPSSYIPRMDTIAYKAWFFWNFGLELLGF